jgi:hypothetical protein
MVTLLVQKLTKLKCKSEKTGSLLRNAQTGRVMQYAAVCRVSGLDFRFGKESNQLSSNPTPVPINMGFFINNAQSA